FAAPVHRHRLGARLIEVDDDGERAAGARGDGLDVRQMVSRRLQGRGEQALDPFDVLVHISSSSLALPPAEVRRTAATARASARRAASSPPYATASGNGTHPIE